MIPFVTALIPVIGGLLDKLIPDEAEAAKQKAEMELRLMEAANDANMAQVEANKVEASHSSVFVAGWRPFIGWCCGAALAFNYVVAPLVVWLGGVIGHPVPVPPSIDDMLFELMFGMLGMAGIRTFEKVKGVAK